MSDRDRPICAGLFLRLLDYASQPEGVPFGNTQERKSGSPESLFPTVAVREAVPPTAAQRLNPKSNGTHHTNRRSPHRATDLESRGTSRRSSHVRASPRPSRLRQGVRTLSPKCFLRFSPRSTAPHFPAGSPPPANVRRRCQPSPARRWHKGSADPLSAPRHKSAPTLALDSF